MLTRRLWPRWLMTAVAPNCRSIFAMELATRIRASHRNSSATCFVPLPRAPSSTDTFEAVFLVPNWLLKTKWHWAEAARYNLSVAQVNQIIEAAVGGVNVTTTVEGRERYRVNVRYASGFRDDL